MADAAPGDLYAPDGRANYVIERLASSDLVPRVPEEDWMQVRTQLASAYGTIDDSMREERRRARVRWILTFLATYALVVCLQWRLDAFWDIDGLSFRTFAVPALAAVQVPVIFYAFVILIATIAVLISGGERGEVLLLLTTLLIICAFWTFITSLIVFFFGYSWTQASIIAVVQPLTGIVVALLAVQVGEVAIAPAMADPRAVLVADLAALLAITAVTLEHDTADFSYGAWRLRKMVKDAALLRRLVPDAEERIADRYPNEEKLDPLPRAVDRLPRVWDWREDRANRRQLSDQLEQTADHMERRLPRVAGRKETAVRSSVRQVAAKIAATLRSYATNVILGGAELDRQLPSQLASALVAASWGRWEELAAEEAPPTVERFINRFGWRIIVAAILVAAGILIPIWFHQLLGDASAQFRIALFTAAVLGLTEAPKAAVERLTNYAESAFGQHR